jgi:hypothetical protein
LGSIGIVSLTNSAKSKIDLLPNNSSSCKGAARRGGQAGPLPVRSSSGPLVGELPRRSRIRRSMVVDTRRRLEDLPRSRLGTAPRFSVVPGSTRCLQLSDWCGLAQDRILRCGSRRLGDGGDEETRTPDPLLAKEMLCQLSYVPLGPEGDGGRFWTRTRDLCLIRAVL